MKYAAPHEDASSHSAVPLVGLLAGEQVIAEMAVLAPFSGASEVEANAASIEYVG